MILIEMMLTTNKCIRLRAKEQGNGVLSDPISVPLNQVDNWLVYGHLTIGKSLQRHEGDRIKKFHLLMRDTARRFFEVRDLDALGWFLKQEGNGKDKLFHFHFGLTADKLEHTTAEVVSRFLTKQCERARGN